MNFSRSQRYLLSILSGILLFLAFPYTGSLTLLVFIGLVPLLLVEHVIYTRKYRPGKIFIHALITFIIYNLGSTWWIWNADPAGAFFAFTLNGLIMATVFQCFSWTKRYVGQKEGYIGLIFFWIAFEFTHYHWELSYPWLNFGNSFSITPQIVQWYSYVGVLGGTLWILITNLIGFKIFNNVLLKKETWKIQTPIFWLLGLVIGIPSVFSAINYYSFEKKQTNIAEVVITQPNIDAYTQKWYLDTKDQIDNIINIGDSLVTSKTKFVLAPETAIPKDLGSGFKYIFEGPFENSALYEYIKKEVTDWNGPELYIGAATYKEFKTKNSRASKPNPYGPGFVESYNTSLLIGKNTFPQYIHKSKLVLGAEKVPFSQYFPWLEELALSNGGTDGTLGIETEAKTLKGKGITFAPIVCYESLYGGFIAEQCRKGAEAIFVITNDGWWGNSPGYRQHRSFSRLRAIETGRWVARSANTGSSCFINPRGEITQQAPYGIRAGLRENIELNKEPTFYVTYGDVIGRSFSFAALLILLFTFVKYFRSRFSD